MMRVRVRGSALLWAVGVLAVLTILVTGILYLSASFAKAEQNQVAQTQADSYAQAGITLTAQTISGAADSPLLPEPHTARTAQYTMETAVCTVTIAREDTTLLLTAQVTVGDCTGVRRGTMTSADGGWRFTGFDS